MRAATEAGFRVTVFLMPILPHLTDSIAAIDDALRRIKEAGAARVVYGALHLRPGVKPWFMQWLEREHPELVSSYLGLYPGASSYAPKGYRSWLAKRVRPLMRVHGLDGQAEDDSTARGAPCRDLPSGASRHDVARARRSGRPRRRCSSDLPCGRAPSPSSPPRYRSTTRIQDDSASERADPSGTGAIGSGVVYARDGVAPGRTLTARSSSIRSSPMRTSSNGASISARSSISFMRRRR